MSESSSSYKKIKVEAEKTERQLFESCIPKECIDKAKGGVIVGEDCFTKLAKMDPKVSSTVVINYDDLYGLPPFSERFTAYLKDSEDNANGPDFSKMEMVTFDSEPDDEPFFIQSDDYKAFVKEKEAAIRARLEEEAKWLPKYKGEMNIESLNKAELEFKNELEKLKVSSSQTDDDGAEDVQ